VNVSSAGPCSERIPHATIQGVDTKLGGAYVCRKGRAAVKLQCAGCPARNGPPSREILSIDIEMVMHFLRLALADTQIGDSIEVAVGFLPRILAGAVSARAVPWLVGATVVARCHAAPRRRPARARATLSLLAFIAIFVSAKAAWSRQGGIETEGCSGCHVGGADPGVSITTDAIVISPGQVIALTIAVSSQKVGGFYLRTNRVGAFSGPGPGVKLWSDGGVSHSQPGAASGGQSTFRVNWTAPQQPSSGGVDFSVWAVSGNGNGASSGDGTATGFLSVAYGCAGAGTKYFSDFDVDGHGSITSGYTMSCTKPPSYAATDGDCDDNDPKVFPGAPEICDGKDNNCNGTIDEGLDIATLCEDKDGDGHGVAGGATKTGCSAAKGFGFCDNDCKDSDPTVYPGATEICNEKDDNCNAMIDERVRPTCGLGWCRRYAQSCVGPCVEGPPKREECNAFDDDCDGANDNGTDLELCGQPDLACRDGRCVPMGGGGTGGSGTGGSGTGGSGAGGSGGTGGSGAGGSGGTGGSGTGGSGTGSGGTGAIGSGSNDAGGSPGDATTTTDTGSPDPPGAQPTVPGDDAGSGGCQIGTRASPAGPGIGALFFAFVLLKKRRAAA
jgi:hypothetical protein